jgi:teichuronic acid exporter
LFIGKIYSSKSLGFFTKGVDFANTMSNTITSVIFAVLFPSFSKIKDDKVKTLLTFKASLRYVSLFVFPLFMLVSILAKPLIVVLLTERWLTTAIVFQYLVLARMINMIALINQQALHGLGFSYITLKQEILKSIVRFVFILFSIKFGIVWIAIGELIATIFNYFINAYPLGKILNFGFMFQVREISPVFISSLLAAIVSYSLINIFENNYLKLLTGPIFLLFIYLILLELFKQKDFIEIRKKIIAKYI